VAWAATHLKGLRLAPGVGSCLGATRGSELVAPDLEIAVDGLQDM
jgi:hypothetical protein